MFVCYLHDLGMRLSSSVSTTSFNSTWFSLIITVSAQVPQPFASVLIWLHLYGIEPNKHKSVVVETCWIQLVM